MAEAIVEVEDLSIQYTVGQQTLTAVDQVSLKVARGSFVTLIGPSGCGKSTLLKSIGGLVPATAGQVRVLGERVAGPRPRTTAIVFQNYALFPWCTVLENVQVGLEFRGEPAARRRERALHYLDMVGLASFADRYPRQISGGMQQRVAVARALCMEPQLLLMDEPFGALDEQTRLLLGEELSRILSRTDATILFVTHSLSEAVLLSDQVVVMTAHPGRIKAVMEINRPHPRTADFMLEPDFNNWRNELFRLLADEIRLSAGLEAGR